MLGGQFKEAYAQGSDLLQTAGDWKVNYHRSMLLCLLSAAAFGKGDAEQGRTHLKDFFQAPPPPADEIHHLAGHFQKITMTAQERQVLMFGRENHPDFRPILEDLLQRDLSRRNYGTLPEHLRETLQVRRKNAQLLHRCREVMASDYFLFLPGRTELIESLENTLRKEEDEGGLPPV